MRTILSTSILFALLPAVSRAITNDFSSYPQGSQSCLYDSANNAGCQSAATGSDLNMCLCKNENNFIYNTASCVAKSSPSDVEAVYDTLSSNCAGTNVVLSVPKAAFLAAAAAATQTSSTTATATASSNPSSTSQQSTSTTSQPSASQSPAGQASTDSGLSTGAKIGIGVGVAFGAVAALLAAWFVWAYQRRRRHVQPIRSEEDMGDTGSGVGTPNMSSIEPYAQSNTQLEAAELAPSSWKRHSELPAYAAWGSKSDTKAREPLVAGFENELEARGTPVELPAS